MSGDLPLSMLLTAKADQARSEIAATTRSVQELGRAGPMAAAGFGATATAAGALQGAMGRLHQTTGANVAVTANLAAQFNDIAVMSMAMQDPLQLAIQQGTQINQEFARMGGHREGIRAIGAAFLSMVSPMSLATLGVIAFGAYGVQWLLSLRQEALTVEDALGALRDEIEGLREASRMAGPSGLDELEQRYGRVTAAVQRLVAAQERAAQLEARQQLDTVRSLEAGRFTGMEAGWDGNADYSRGLAEVEDLLGNGSEAADRFYFSVQRLSSVDDPEQLADIFASLSAQIEEAARQSGSMTSAQREYLATLVAAETAAREFLGAQEGNRVADERRAQTMLAELEVAAAVAQYGEDARLVTELRVAAERDAFEETLRTLDVSEELKAQLLASWDAVKGLAAVDMASGIARARAEAQAMADEVQRALGAAQSLSVQGAAGLEDARIRAQYEDPAEQAYYLGVARMRRVQGPLREGAEPDTLAALDAEAAAYGRTEAETARLAAAQRDLARSRRDATGAGADAREQVAELIVDLQTEIDILRETDPVQQEMIRQREALAGATADERAQIEDLIRVRIAEQETLRETERSMESVRDLGRDVLRGIVSDLRAGANAGDIMANVLDKLADKLIDMGTSSLADILFGGSGSSSRGLLGGLIGSLFGVRANAKGDVVGEPTLFAYGDGRGLGVMGEDGAEAIMPLTHAFGGGVGAVVAGRETTLALTRLASGKLGVVVPGQIAAFAQGGTFGFVPPPPAMAPTPAANGATAQGQIIGTLVIQHSKDFDVRFSGRMRDVAVQISGEQIEAYDRSVLPARVGQIAGDPAVKG